ncbi:DHA2 family efflux MFS transporter permease subunit OS=Streptomyces alboniger OX=132473 GN=CP975_01540 PE=4 SV=1 [Streptomyces alboniger]
MLPDAAASFYRGVATKDQSLVADAADALTHGYTLAFVAAGVMFLAGLVVTALAVNAKAQQSAEGMAPVHLG